MITTKENSATNNQLLILYFNLLALKHPKTKTDYLNGMLIPTLGFFIQCQMAAMSFYCNLVLMNFI